MREVLGPLNLHPGDLLGSREPLHHRVLAEVGLVIGPVDDENGYGDLGSGGSERGLCGVAGHGKFAWMISKSNERKQGQVTCLGPHTERVSRLQRFSSQDSGSQFSLVPVSETSGTPHSEDSLTHRTHGYTSPAARAHPSPPLGQSRS